MIRRLLALAVLALVAPVTGSAQGASSAPSAAANTLTAAERAAGWRLLFDGTSMSAWRGYQQDAMPPEWMAVDGTLTKIRNTNDIVTREQFGDFELLIEWKVAARGNAGIFYRATEAETKVYWSAPEYQLAEDSLTPDSRNMLTAVAAVYGFYPSKRGVAKAAGEWNSTRIVAKGAHVEHWLNGQLIAQYELGSPDWTEKFKASKFAPYPEWGRAKRGYIAIQGDHNGALSLRNIKIRELK